MKTLHLVGMILVGMIQRMPIQPDDHQTGDSALNRGDRDREPH